MNRTTWSLSVCLICILLRPAAANFGGYQEKKDAFSATLLSPEPNPSISLEKEVLNFDLGQRVGFSGKFWFKNNGRETARVKIAFPQLAQWQVQGAYPNYSLKPKASGFQRLKAELKIDGKKVDTQELYSVVPASGNYLTDVRLVGEDGMTQEFAKFRAHDEGYEGWGMDFLVWNVSKMELPPNGSTTVEINFVRSWSYQDSVFSNHTESDGVRYFDYITSTARSWANQEVKDFEANVKYPAESEKFLEFSPNGWENMAPGEKRLHRTHWSPKLQDHLRFAWHSNIQIDAPEEYVTNLYYKDYDWRKASDGTTATAWCLWDLHGELGPFALLHGHVNVMQIKSINNPATASFLRIVPGFAKDADTFKANSRPKTLELTVCKGSVGQGGEGYDSACLRAPQIWNTQWKQSVTLKDSMEPQMIHLDQEIDPTTDVVDLTIKDVYHGASSSDVCISEIQYVPAEPGGVK